MGYTITRVHGGLLYEERTDLFESFVETHLKGKLEASKDCAPGEAASLCAEARERYGIAIDPRAIKRNPGKCAISKLSLNSLSRLGQALTKHGGADA